MSSIFQESNHKERALSTMIPYALKFQQAYKLAEQSGDRAQVIEDAAWQLLYNLDFRYATGVWLDYIGTKVALARTYTTKPEGAFTFGGTADEGFGKGKFFGKGSGVDTRISRSDYDYRNAIKAQIIRNNTDSSLDEVISAIKLLFNADIVRIVEDYPASISHIDILGSNVIEYDNPGGLIKSILPAGVGLGSVSYNSLYNLFINDAFIEYSDALIPESDDFELSLIVIPNTLSSENPTAILSQGNTWASIYTPVRLYYDPDDGVVFRTSPENYNDDFTGTTFYEDEDEELYLAGDAEIYLNGGTLNINRPNIIKVTRTGNVWKLFVNNSEVDSAISDVEINQENVKFYLGTSNAQFYNSGSIYNLLLENKTTNSIILNDPLNGTTIGTNNGVIFYQRGN